MVINLTDSYIEWETHEGSLGRFNIESCLFSNGEEVFLGSEVMACNVYSKHRLIKEPSYLFQAAFSVKRYKVFRSMTASRNENDTRWKDHDLFKKVRIQLREATGYYEIRSYEDLLIRYNDGAAFSAYVSTSSGTFQFPVKHINIHIGNKNFQAETGPVILFDQEEITRAYVAFSDFSRIEFIIETYSEGKRTFRKNMVLPGKITLITSQ